MQRNALYTILFATAVCIVCAIVVSSAAVSLKPAQEINAALEKQRNVLLAAGLLQADEKVDAAEAQRRFENIRMAVVNLETGEENTNVEFAGPAVTVEPGPSGGPGKLSEALGLARDAPEEPAVGLHIFHPRVDVELEPRKHGA